jgi:hypothetical protein
METISEKVSFGGYLKNCSIKNESINFGKSTFGNLRFDNATIFKPIILNNLSVKELQIRSSQFYSSFAFGNWNMDKLIADDIGIESSKFHHRVDFISGEIKKGLYIHKVEFNEQFMLRKEFVLNRIYFIEVKASHNASIDFQDNFDAIEITDSHFDTSLFVNSSSILDDKLVSISFSGIIHGNYIFENIPTVSVHISCVNFGNILFHNISSKFIWCDRFFNYNKLFFNGLILNENYNVLIVFDSNIGNTEFENIDFRKFNEVVIAKSDVSSMQITNSIFPKSIGIKTKRPDIGVEVGELEKINDNMYFRESYRQLKVAMEKIGNRYYSLHYKSKEMHYQRKELKFGWDKILLYINFLSNNNGVSWVRGIFFTIICGYISFVFLNTFSKHPIFYWDIHVSKKDFILAFDISLTQFIKYISSFPLLKSDMQNDGNWKTDFIILISRIFISVGIFQTISAFRKYSK